jgi:hypothetical protein
VPSKPGYIAWNPKSPATYLREYNERAAFLQECHRRATVVYSPTDPYYDPSSAGKPYSPPSAVYKEPAVDASPKYMITNHPLFTKPTPPRPSQPDNCWGYPPPPPLEAGLPPPAPPLDCVATCNCQYCIAGTHHELVFSGDKQKHSGHADNGKCTVMKELVVELEPKMKQKLNSYDEKVDDMSVNIEPPAKKHKSEMELPENIML